MNGACHASGTVSYTNNGTTLTQPVLSSECGYLTDRFVDVTVWAGAKTNQTSSLILKLGLPIHPDVTLTTFEYSQSKIPRSNGAMVEIEVAGECTANPGSCATASKPTVSYNELSVKAGESVSLKSSAGGAISLPASLGETADAIAEAPSVALVAGGTLSFQVTLHFEEAEKLAAASPSSGGASSGGASSGGTCNQSACDAYTNQCAQQQASQAPCYCAAACLCQCSGDSSCAATNRKSASDLGTSCSF